MDNLRALFNADAVRSNQDRFVSIYLRANQQVRATALTNLCLVEREGPLWPFPRKFVTCLVNDLPVVAYDLGNYSAARLAKIYKDQADLIDGKAVGAIASTAQGYTNTKCLVPPPLRQLIDVINDCAATTGHFYDFYADAPTSTAASRGPLVRPS